jgi:hypothetical protein
MKILVLFLSCTLFLFNSTTTQNLDEFVKVFVKANRVDYQHIGRGSSESEVYKTYQKFSKTGRIDEFLKLTNHPNPVVRCYAGWALIDNSYSELNNIYLQFLKSDTTVETYSGCIVGSDPLSSEFYHKYWNSISPEMRATDQMLITLDSISLYNSNTYWLLTHRALNNRLYSASFTSQIEELAFKDMNFSAIDYFANWHKAQYKDRLKEALLTYLDKTEFKTVGTSEYYNVVEHLLSFKDAKIEDRIVEKLKKDRFWQHSKEKFKFLLEEHGIYGMEYL